MSVGAEQGPEPLHQQEVYVMTIVRRVSPLGELVSLRQAMDRLFEDSFVRPRGWAAGAGDGYGFPIDVRTGPDVLTVEASLPGYRLEDVEVTVENGTLTIHAESSSERTDGEGESLISEIRRGSVSRMVSLPTGLEPDKATATFEQGVLKLRIPRAEAVKPRQIRITPTTHETATNGSKGIASGESATKSAETATETATRSTAQADV
jgi:HSP20 family protein